MRPARPPISAPRSGRSYLVRETAGGADRLLLALTVHPRPQLRYPSQERWWPVEVIGPHGAERVFWGEYSADEWQELP